ncbi:MAG: NifU family protein [Gemmatimonadales bacterium]|nr:NifU family protein [Gemmatimonadales bacterium]
MPERTNMIAKINAVLDEIRPTLQADGGDVEFIDFKDGVVLVRMKGACGNCPMSQITLKQGIEARMKERVPEVLSVEQI